MEERSDIPLNFAENDSADKVNLFSLSIKIKTPLSQTEEWVLTLGRRGFENLKLKSKNANILPSIKEPKSQYQHSLTDGDDR